MGKSKKIVCLIGQLGNGGTEKQLRLFLKFLPKDEFSPKVIVCSSTCRGGGIESEILQECDGRLEYLSGSPLVKFAKYFGALLAESPDCAISWSFYTNAFCRAPFQSNFIGSLRGGLDIAKKQLSSANFANSLRPKRFIVNSLHLKGQLVCEGIAEERVSVIPNIFERRFSLDENLKLREEIRRGTRDSLGLSDSDLLIVGGGRDTPEKDIPFFLDTVSEVFEREPRARALLVGDCARNLPCEIRSRGLENRVHLHLAPKGIHSVLPAADIFFLSSKSEGMPNLLLEAIDSGAAPVSTDVGGTREILSGTSAPILECRDPEIAADRIVRILSDPELRDRISMECIRKLDEFSQSCLMRKYIELIG